MPKIILTATCPHCQYYLDIELDLGTGGIVCTPRTSLLEPNPGGAAHHLPIHRTDLDLYLLEQQRQQQREARAQAKTSETQAQKGVLPFRTLPGPPKRKPPRK